MTFRQQRRGFGSGPHNGWTVETLLTHVHSLLEQRDSVDAERDRRHAELFREKDLRDQQRFDAQQKALTDALLAQEKAAGAALQAANAAVAKAETANEKRLDGVNEFRGALDDYARTLMPRTETVTLIAGLTEKIDSLEKRTNTSEGRTVGVGQFWGALLAVAGLALGIGIFIHSLLIGK